MERGVGAKRCRLSLVLSGEMRTHPRTNRCLKVARAAARARWLLSKAGIRSASSWDRRRSGRVRP